MKQSVTCDPRTGSHDRGPTPYFHGRADILAGFARTLSDVRATGGGMVRLIYGAPGSGKTALLHECKNTADSKGFESFYITVPSLWEADNLREIMGRDGEYSSSESTHQVGLKGIYTWARKRVRSKTSVKRLLRESSKPLLLILDEVQSIGNKDILRPQHKAKVTELLELIHNGKIGRPIILLTAGLGSALTALKTLDISRFGEKNTSEIGSLSTEDARAVIRDWLVRDGMARGDTSEWVNMIAKEAGVWPRHVHSYSVHASKHLKSRDGVMTAEGLQEIIAKGKEGRIGYYKERVSDFYVDEIKHLAKYLRKTSAGGVFDCLDVLKSLTNIYGDKKATDLFDRLLEEGVIAAKGGDGYHIPIDSMHTWLVDTYTKGKSKGHGASRKALNDDPTQKALPPVKKDDPSQIKEKDSDPARKRGRDGHYLHGGKHHSEANPNGHSNHLSIQPLTQSVVNTPTCKLKW